MLFSIENHIILSKIYQILKNDTIGKIKIRNRIISKTSMKKHIAATTNTSKYIFI